MTKFDQIIAEAETAVTNANLTQVQNVLKSAPPNVQNVLNTVFNKTGTQAGSNHDVWVKLADVLNDKTPTKFSNLDDTTKAKALDLLSKAGVPVQKPENNSPEKPAGSTDNKDKTSASQNASTQTQNTGSTKIPTTVKGAVV